MDDSIDLGGQYRFIQEYPQCIIHHTMEEYKGVGVNVVEPIVVAFSFNDDYIIAKSKAPNNGQARNKQEYRYWIINKVNQQLEPAALDSSAFQEQLRELNIGLSF
ncbi:MAG: DUF3997 domain-containing protein [Oceanospirillaceae bacterium]|nr:DUF3997 domain-containing protein [Oceanospirillaceae bacterium]